VSRTASCPTSTPATSPWRNQRPTQPARGARVRRPHGIQMITIWTAIRVGIAKTIERILEVALETAPTAWSAHRPRRHGSGFTTGVTDAGVPVRLTPREVIRVIRVRRQGVEASRHHGVSRRSYDPDANRPRACDAPARLTRSGCAGQPQAPGRCVHPRLGGARRAEGEGDRLSRRQQRGEWRSTKRASSPRAPRAA
jgi:hypothetical protein